MNPNSTPNNLRTFLTGLIKITIAIVIVFAAVVLILIGMRPIPAEANEPYFPKRRTKIERVYINTTNDTLKVFNNRGRMVEYFLPRCKTTITNWVTTQSSTMEHIKGYNAAFYTKSDTFVLGGVDVTSVVNERDCCRILWDRRFMFVFTISAHFKQNLIND